MECEALGDFIGWILWFSPVFSIIAGTVEIFFVTSAHMVGLRLQLRRMLNQFAFVIDAWCGLGISLLRIVTYFSYFIFGSTRESIVVNSWMDLSKLWIANRETHLLDMIGYSLYVYADTYKSIFIALQNWTRWQFYSSFPQSNVESFPLKTWNFEVQNY